MLEQQARFGSTGRHPRVFFGSPHFGEGLPWSRLRPLLSGWDLVIAERASLAELGPEVDVLVPVGAPVDADRIRAGRLGMIHQFGVGVENIDVELPPPPVSGCVGCRRT